MCDKIKDNKVSSNKIIKPFAYVNHARTRVLNNSTKLREGKVSTTKQYLEPLKGFEVTTYRLRVRHASHCATS